MEWRSAEKDKDGKLEIPKGWLFPHYYDGLTVLFRVENALRLFVYMVLKDRYGSKWKDLEIASDEDAKTSIIALSKRRIEQSKAFGYLSYSIQSPLMHLTSGELARLMTHDSYWPLFKDYFRAAKNVVTLKLSEIGVIRNALAHFRPVSSNDVEVVKQNAIQMMSVIEDTLIDLIQCGQNVPTNTPDEWYGQLRTLGTDLISLSFNQGIDEKWIRITLRQNIVIVSGTPVPERKWQRYRVIVLNGPALLQTQRILADRVLFMTDRVPSLQLGTNLLPKGRKELGLTFSRRVLEETYAEIKPVLEETLAQISKETELLKEDQLARGTLVQLRTVNAHREIFENSSFWMIDKNDITSPSPSEELPEYWGEISASANFISDSEDYPWMPVKVSEEDFPF